MSNGRKIFRFLKFVEDIKKFYSYLYDSSFDFLTILKAFTTLSACFYHFLDNLVWASNVGMINRIITGEIGWKTSKNFFSIVRTLIKLITDFVDLKTYYYGSWMNNDNEIKNENYEKLIAETIKNRSKLRMLTLDIIHACLKLVTLIYSMKFEPVFSFLHPIIVAFSGILYCVISLFKIYFKTTTLQKKMLKSFRKSNEVIAKTRSGEANNGLYLHTNFSSSWNLHHTAKDRRKSFEASLIEHIPNQKLLYDEYYFDNYYIDFNKDYPIVPELILKANGGEQSFN
jgi:hypothetical protein